MKCVTAILALSAVSVLAGCASVPGPNCVRFSEAGFFCLLDPAMLTPRRGIDLVTVARHGDVMHYVSQLSLTRAHMTLALYSLAGVPLGEINWNGTTATIRAPRSIGLKPGKIVALLQLTLAPPRLLRGALHGLSLSSTQHGSGVERQLRAGGAILARAFIERTGKIRVEIPSESLTIVMRSISGRNE